MGDFMKQIYPIFWLVVIVAAVMVVQHFGTQYNKKKRYEAKVKAGIIKEGEPVVAETAEEKKAKMDAAFKILENSRKEKKSSSMGKYLVKKTNTGFNFSLKATNSETIGTSEVYSSKAAAIAGTESVKRFAPLAEVEDQTVSNFEEKKNPKFEIYRDKAGEFRFRLKASNGENILASEGYTSKTNCKNGIESVVNNADSEIVEE